MLDSVGDASEITIEKRKEGNGNDDSIELRFDTENSSSKTYILDIGKYWGGESFYCYICRGDDSNCLVIEKLMPTSSTVSTDTFYIGKDGGTRSESIRVIDLDDFFEISFELKYDETYGNFTIQEETSRTDESVRQQQYLYCQDSEKVHYGDGFESLYPSYEKAIEHIQNALLKYGVKSCVGTDSGNREDERQLIPLIAGHRNGVKKDIPLDSISELTLTDELILGVNNQYTTEVVDETESDLNTVMPSFGVWDSDDGKMRLVFGSKGSDFSVIQGGLAETDGTLGIIDLVKGEKKYGGYILDGEFITIVSDSKEEVFNFSCSGETLFFDEKEFHLIDRELVDQLIGTWQGENIRIIFDENNGAGFYDDSGNAQHQSEFRSFYAVLSESEVLVNAEGYDVNIIDYSVDGTTLNWDGILLYKDSYDTSYSYIQFLKENLEGTWKADGSLPNAYYVFTKDGYYETYATESMFLIGHTLEEGTYEIANENEINLHKDGYAWAYTVLRYDESGQLVTSSGDVYRKLD